MLGSVGAGPGFEKCLFFILALHTVSLYPLYFGKWVHLFLQSVFEVIIWMVMEIYTIISYSLQ